jgi:hypothetical protein
LADGTTETVVDQDKSNFYRTDTWAVRSPLQAWSGAANLGKVYDPTLHGADEANGIAATTVDITAKAKTAWAKLVLKDYIGQTVVSMEKTADGKALTGKLVEDTEMYRTDKSKSTGLEFDIDDNSKKDWSIDKSDGTLTFTGNTAGASYDKVITITVKYTHDYGTSSFTYTVEVIRDVDPAAK